MNYENTTQVEYSNNGISNFSKRFIYVLKKPLNERETIAFMTSYQPYSIIPSNFFAICKLKSSFDNILNEIIAHENQRILNETLYNERMKLRNEKKRPWSQRTRRPFRYIIDSVRPTFKDRYILALKVVDIIGTPFTISTNKRGRKCTYDLSKTTAAILAKGELSFESLSKEIESLGIDFTINGSKKYPKHSYLHELFEKVSEEYYQNALNALDNMIKQEYSMFEEDIENYAGDNTAIKCDALEKRRIRYKIRLARANYHIFVCSRIGTNSITYIANGTNKVKDLMSVLPEHSLLVLDAEFDVESNYNYALLNGIDIQVRQKKTKPRKRGRKKGKERFNIKKYRKRKLVERVFGNMVKRRILLYYRKNKMKGSILIGINHNIINYYKSEKWCSLFINIEV